MNSSFSLMSYAFIGLRLIVMALVFVGFVIAWKKYRHLGFGVLAGWALASEAWIVFQNGWFQFTQSFLRSGTQYGQLVILSNFLAIAFQYALLLAGVALLAWIPIKPRAPMT
jgi:hypothetical protein